MDSAIKISPKSSLHSSPLKFRLNAKIKKQKSKLLHAKSFEQLSPVSEIQSSEDYSQIDTDRLAVELKRSLSQSSDSINCMDQFLAKLTSFKVPFNLLLAVLEALKPFILSDQG